MTMAADRFTLRCAVYAILVRDGKVLLLRRANTGWMDGKYSLPAGHLENGEAVVAALCRETREEVGVELDEKTIELVHTMHRYSLYIDLFFTATWKGELTNREPDKHDELRWAPLDAFPENMVPSVRIALDAYRRGERFSEIQHETGI